MLHNTAELLSEEFSTILQEGREVQKATYVPPYFEGNQKTYDLEGENENSVAAVEGFGEMLVEAVGVWLHDGEEMVGQFEKEIRPLLSSAFEEFYADAEASGVGARCGDYPLSAPGFRSLVDVAWPESVVEDPLDQRWIARSHHRT